MTTVLPTCAPPDPGERGPSFDIVRCDESQYWRLDFFSLSADVTGFDVHWSYGKTHICTLPWGECKLCRGGSGKRWVGYLAAMDELKNKRFLAELTPGVMPSVKQFIEGRGSLRGRKLRLLRPSRHKCGPLKIEFQSEAMTIPDDQCPEPFDIEGVLAKIYNLEISKTPSSPTKTTHADVLNGILASGRVSTAADLLPENLTAEEQADRLRDYTSNGKH